MNEIDDILRGIRQKDPRAIGRAISMVEEGDQRAGEILRILDEEKVQTATIIGITGSPGVGKSTLVDQLISYYRRQGLRIGIVAIDPSSPVSGGAFLGDRIRMMRHTIYQDVLIRSMATRGRLGGGVCGGRCGCQNHGRFRVQSCHCRNGGYWTGGS